MTSFVTIVAHTDDDLLFINPDIQAAIPSGFPVRTIVITADEFNGTGDLTREELAADLQEGSRSAYAALADVPNSWARDTLEVAGRTVEIDTLLARPHVQTVYLSLPDGGDSLRRDALTHLWEQPGFVTETIIPAGSPVDEVQHYSHDDLHAVLVALLELFQATTIRVQDPYPDPRYVDLGEHADHIAAARFAQQAVRTYEGPGGDPSLLVRYRGYNTRQSPANVPDPLLDNKTRGYRAYGALDPLTGTAFDINLPRGYPRFPVAPRWVTRDGTGVWHAVVAGADDVIHWRRDANGWSGPESLRSGSFAPGVAMARNANGLLQLAVLDLDTAAVLTSRQNGNGFGEWTSLGTPGGELLSAPAFGVNTAGRLELYMCGKGGRLSTAFQGTPNGAITGWFDVGGGPNLVGPPLVHLAVDGWLHVFADGNGTVLHWTQPPEGGSTTFDESFPGVECVATPGVVTDPTGEVRMVVREHTDGATGTIVHNGGWSSLTHLGGHGGVGPVAAVTSGGPNPGVLVFARNDEYGISVSRSLGPWEKLGGYCEIGPAAILDDGLVRLLAVGGDCRLHERVQTTPGPNAPFAPWRQVG